MYINEITTCIVEVFFVDFNDPFSTKLTSSENCLISGKHVVLHGQTAFFLCHWVARAGWRKNGPVYMYPHLF